MRALAARAAAGVPSPRPPRARPIALHGPSPTCDAGPAEPEALALLAAAGLAVVESRHVHDARDLGAALGALADAGEGRFAIKAVAPDLPHKSDAGAVALHVGADDAPAAYERVVAAARAAGATPDGAIVQAMARPGLELIVGARRDPTLGTVVMVGLGGTLAESLGDVVVRALPLGESEAAGMLDDLRGAALLDGARGAAPVDRAAVARAVEGVAALAEALGPGLEAVEVNPLVAHAEGATCVDALLLLSRSEEP
jgi:hypothetical protein